MKNNTMNLKKYKIKKTGYHVIHKDIFDVDYGLNINAKIVFCYLSKCVDRRTAKCFPSRKSIAMNCSIGITSVDKALKDLQACELIKK